MDFMIVLPRTKCQHDSIMVVVDTLTKATHFIHVQATFGTANIAIIFMKEIFRLYGVPKMIVLDRDVEFTSKLWKALFGGMGTQLNFSTAYHPQMDGQIGRNNNILEDMLRMYVMDRPTK